MKLLIEIEMDNAAFENHNGMEASRILYNLALDRLRHNVLEADDRFTLVDHNGNTVGIATVKED